MIAVYVWDVARVVALFEAVAVCGMVGGVMWFYANRWQAAKRAADPIGRRESGKREHPGRRTVDMLAWLGLLPAHVALVSAGTLLLVAAECAQIVYAVGDPPKWYGLPSGIVAFTLLLWALERLLRYEYRMYRGPRDSIRNGR